MPSANLYAPSWLILFDLRIFMKVLNVGNNFNLNYNINNSFKNLLLYI